MTKKTNMTYLQLLLISRGFTIKDLKVEVVLMMCHNLLGQYLRSEDENKTIAVLNVEDESRDTQYIISQMKLIHENLDKTILTIERANQILYDAKVHKINLEKAELIKPMVFFYNKLVLSFTKYSDTYLMENGKKMWIPDLIAVLLIQDMQDKNYNFKKFDYIDKFDFSKLNEIYQKTNLKLKEGRGLKGFRISLEKHTLISKIEMFVQKMVNDLIQVKYKEQRKKKN